jgi:hypothetical protein
MQVTATRDSHYCTCLGHLGRCDRDRIFSNSVALLKVAKASTKCVAVECHCRWCCRATFANVNTALHSGKNRSKLVRFKEQKNISRIFKKPSLGRFKP